MFNSTSSRFYAAASHLFLLLSPMLPFIGVGGLYTAGIGVCVFAVKCISICLSINKIVNSLLLFC